MIFEVGVGGCPLERCNCYEFPTFALYLSHAILPGFELRLSRIVDPSVWLDDSMFKTLMYVLPLLQDLTADSTDQLSPKALKYRTPKHFRT